MEQQLQHNSLAKYTVSELGLGEWKLVKKGFLHEHWQRPSVVKQKGVNIDGVETYKTWGFGLVPPPSYSMVISFDTGVDFLPDPSPESTEKKESTLGDSRKP